MSDGEQLHPSCYESGDCCADPCGSVYTHEEEATVYEWREAALESLAIHGRLHEKLKKRRERWRTARAGVWLAPFITAAVIVPPVVRKHESPDSALYIEVPVLFASVGGFIGADRKRRQAAARIYETGRSAVPIVETLGIATPSWLEEALQPDKDPNPYASARKSA